MFATEQRVTKETAGASAETKVKKKWKKDVYIVLKIK